MKNKELSNEERAEELLSKAREGDKKAAADAYNLFRKLKDKSKAREARVLMR